MAFPSSDYLTECLHNGNCIRVERYFSKPKEVFKDLVDIASALPRVTVVDKRENYWHGVVRSLIFRFPDDLEILYIPNEKVIQVKSASRIGLGDFGVNSNRIKYLFDKLS